MGVILVYWWRKYRLGDGLIFDLGWIPIALLNHTVHVD